MNSQNSMFRDGTVAAKIFALGQEIFESKTNKEITALVGMTNEGQVSVNRKTVSDRTGWKMIGRETQAATTNTTPAAPKARKPAGSLPAKIEGFLVGLVDDVPDVWEPVHVYPVIDADDVSWNRFVRRMVDLDESMIASFERWLGRGATLSRQESFDAVAAVAARWDSKAKAEDLARELIAMGYGDKTPTAILREGWL